MGLVSATIKSNGTSINPEYELLYIDIIHEYNKIPWAEISFIDGDLARQKFDVSDSVSFEPGAEIEIKLKYEGVSSADKTVFKGVVVRQALQTTRNGCVLVAELSDEAIRMTSARKSALSENVKDSAVIQKIITDNGLTAGTIATTEVQHKRIVQYYATDWDFIMSRAEANGLLVSVEGGAISATKPTVSGKASHKFNFSKDEIYDFDFEADGRHQFSSIESTGWDVKKQQLASPKSAKEFSLNQGNLTPGKIAKKVGGKTDALISAVGFEENEAKAWADAKMVRSRLSLLKGRLKVPGSAEIKLGELIELQGMGKRFSGTTMVTGVRQQLTADGWFTDIQFGLSAEWFLAKNNNVVDAKAAGLLPGINGLQIGIVEKLEDDPDQEDRVKVKIPSIDNGENGIWCRMLSPDAGNKRGVVFWPEPGDEVILGFLNDDPREPVILGSVHSSANPSPVIAAAKNPEKGIVTKQGLKMLFNDEEKTVTISTSDDSSIIINEKKKSIEIKDANKNTVTLDDKGITMQSDKDIIIKSGANVKIEGKAVEIKGNKVDII